MAQNEDEVQWRSIWCSACEMSTGHQIILGKWCCARCSFLQAARLTPDEKKKISDGVPKVTVIVVPTLDPEKREDYLRELEKVDPKP